MLKGRVFKLGDDISTDHIIPGRFFHLRSNVPELARHTLEDVAPNLVLDVKQGDFIVAGRNFGLGSSREHAPLVIKTVGIGAVLVESVARIFFRNAINIGLPVLICDTENIDAEDELIIDMAKGTIEDVTKGFHLEFNKFPGVMIEILGEGGLLPYIKKHGDFVVSV
ncbi:MAG: 3-isopropylmalate dehydratase small subunit [Dehalococcoidia bacterium]|nr:3-isopropylmalate dehydratase small subunit [Dehalococcoidia bacterium]